MSAADSADYKTSDRREDTLDFTALKMFRKGDQVVSAVHHLSVDSTGFDNAFAPVLLQLVAVEPQDLADLAEREVHRAKEYTILQGHIFGYHSHIPQD